VLTTYIFKLTKLGRRRSYNTAAAVAII